MASSTEVRALLVAGILTLGGVAGCTTDPAEDRDDLSPSPQGELDDVGPEPQDPIIGGEGAGGERDARPQAEGFDPSPGP